MNPWEYRYELLTIFMPASRTWIIYEKFQLLTRFYASPLDMDPIWGIWQGPEFSPLQQPEWPQSQPRGSKYPIFNDSGPKNHSGHGIWNQSPHILGTWTLWEPQGKLYRRPRRADKPAARTTSQSKGLSLPDIHVISLLGLT